MMYKLLIKAGRVCCLSLLLVCAGHAEAATEGFDNGQGDWEQGTYYSVLEYRATGGNPGGYMLFHGPETVGISTKNPVFTGDYAAAGYDEITLDLNVQLMPITQPRPDVLLRSSASVAGWSYKLSSMSLQGGVWQHFEIPMNPNWSDAEATAAGWRIDTGPAISFADTMRHVWVLSVRIKYVPTTAVFLGVDNITLRKKPRPISERLRQNTRTMDRKAPAPRLSSPKPGQ